MEIDANRKARIDRLVEDKAAVFDEVSDKVWEYAELGFSEFRSSACQQEAMKAQGFHVESNLADMETAFIASYGEGKPVIAILGEFDALAAMSQQAGEFSHKPVCEGAPGHGCGHNFLGAASMAAATAVKDYLAENHLPGTVRYYGCPAEEGGCGKVFFIRGGYFKDADIALAWHPSQFNHVWDGVDCLGIVSTRYHFEGVSAHAAASPQLGRSALDACELMNVGVNYLREHVIPSARIHYAYLDAGGAAANVVQAKATLLYVVRAPKMEQVYEIAARVDKIAEGAALMTGTKMTRKVVAGTSNLIATPAVFDRYDANLRSFLPIPFTREELDYAKSFKDTLDKSDEMRMMDSLKKNYPDKSQAELREMLDMPMANYVCREEGNSASTDAGDVTWVVPGCQLHVALYPAGTPFHSWQMTSMGKSAVAKRGMHTASKVLAMTALDFLLDEKLVAQAKADHLEKLGGSTYKIAFDDDTMPGGHT